MSEKEARMTTTGVYQQITFGKSCQISLTCTVFFENGLCDCHAVKVNCYLSDF